MFTCYFLNFVLCYVQVYEISCENISACKQYLCKGQLISKANLQAMNSSKIQINGFVFTTMRRFFVHFLEEIEYTKKKFLN